MITRTPTKTATLFIHLTGWLLFLSLPMLFITGMNSDTPATSLLTSPNYWLFFCCYAFIFYLHTYFILPLWLDQKHYILYTFSIIALLALILFARPFNSLLSYHMPGGPRMEPPGNAPPPDLLRPRHQNTDIVSIALFLLTLSLSFAIEASRKWRLSQQRTLVAETEKAQTELSILKAQINPHFLLNTLNNIYSLASSNNPGASPSILRLSNVLRYVTDEATHDFVPLNAEIHCIHDYIDLQRLQLTTKTTLLLDIPEPGQPLQIAPMILLTFIENAFKFGISAHDPGTITIRINTTGNTIHFFCQNTIFSNAGQEGNSGIGLVNTQKRLDYLYTNRYDLETTVTSQLYTVQLTIHT